MVGFGWLRHGAARKEAARLALARVTAHPLVADAGIGAGAGPELPLDDQLFDDVQRLSDIDEGEPVLIRLWCEHPNRMLVSLAGDGLVKRRTPAAREALLGAPREVDPVVEAIASDPRPRVDLVRRWAAQARWAGDTLAEELVLGVLHVLAVAAMDTQSAPEWRTLVEELRGADAIGRAADTALAGLRASRGR